MSLKTDLSISSCWIVTEGLIGLKNQAIGLAQALGVSYVLKEVKKPQNILKRFFHPKTFDLAGPWPDLLISCGRQSVPVSVAVRRASKNKTFTVHIQHPLVDPKQFDVVVVPAHDKLQGPNVVVTQGAIHQVTREKLIEAGKHFSPLLGTLPHPMISVLVGGKNRHQDFSPLTAHDFVEKLLTAQINSGGGLAITTSRRTGAENEAIIRQHLAGVPCYLWDGKGENPYFGMLGLADVIIVTSDSLSMISEACSTGKPVYIYELPHCGRRHKMLCESLIKSGIARAFTGTVEHWTYPPLDETSKAAAFVRERFLTKNKSP